MSWSKYIKLIICWIVLSSKRLVICSLNHFCISMTLQFVKWRHQRHKHEFLATNIPRTIMYKFELLNWHYVQTFWKSCLWIFRAHFLDINMYFSEMNYGFWNPYIITHISWLNYYGYCNKPMVILWLLGF